MVTVFSRPEFDRSPSLWTRSTHAVGKFLDWIPFGTTGRFLGWILLTLALGYLAYRLIAAATRAVRRWRDRPEQDHVVDEVVGDIAARDPDEWRAEGLEHAVVEDWKEAIRCRYAEIVATLFLFGRAVEEAGRTTGELRADVARSTPSCAAPFTEITSIFEVVWFADRAATRENHERLITLVALIHRDLAATPADGLARSGDTRP